MQVQTRILSVLIVHELVIDHAPLQACPPDTLALMDLEHFRKVLLAKEKELTDEISRLADDARTTRAAEVEDPMDEVTTDQEEATALEETSNLSATLAQVRSALQRIDRGEYGRCVDCGREIKLARLEAVPWTPYCIDDQQKHDKRKGLSTPSL